MTTRLSTFALAALLAHTPAATAATAAPAAPGVTVRFEDVSVERGIQPYLMTSAMGAGIAAADYDDDGDVDLFVPNEGGAPDQLYRNLGDGRFEEIAGAVGVASLGRSRLGLWFDYDGDGRLDLFVAGDCWEAPPTCPDTSTLHLYHQRADGRFDDVTASAGLGDDLVNSRGPHRGGTCAGDLDGDGYLDLVTGLWLGYARVFRNRRDGTFEEISQSSGIGVPFGHHWQQVVHDFDGDGRMDLYSAIDFNENHLWMNEGGATFVDMAWESGANSAWNDMGVALSDYDNDGDVDVYITNIEGPSRRNVLYRNDSNEKGLRFEDVAVDAGVERGGWGWGCTFLDVDNDGWLDVAATNGWREGGGIADRSKLFLNRGGAPVAFEDVSEAAGFDDEYWGSGLVTFDADLDGDLDLVQLCNGTGPQPAAIRLLDNRPAAPAAPGHWLLVRPRMPGANHRAIGARVRVATGGTWRMRLITAGTSFLSQEPAEAHFGLGAAAAADVVVVEWPDGRSTERTDVAVDQVLTIVQPAPGDLDENGVVDVGDLLDLLKTWGACPGPPRACPGDLDASGDVTHLDLLRLLREWS